MKLNSFEEVKRLTQEMVAIPSINKEPKGETAVAKYIYDYYMGLDYFKEYPERVKMFQTKNDFVERHSTYAYVKGTKGDSGRTVILIGHLDTVGVDDFGTIREYAFKCEELPEKLKETFKLSDEVLEDIESGEYMFGRGALDMKSGCAAIMLTLAKFAEEHLREGSFRGKLIYHLVSDEEGPYGLGTVYIINDKIHNIQEEADFAIIAEPSAGFTRVPHPCLCLGARGGYNYTIKVHGKSAHAATPELGINAMVDASAIVSELEKIPPEEDEKLGHSTPCVIRMNGGGAASRIMPKWKSSTIRSEERLRRR